MAVLKPQVQTPSFKNAKEERFYRHSNPTSDYTKQVDLKYINTIGSALKNNAGVSQAQLSDYNSRLQKWNINPNNEKNMFEEMMNQQKGYIDNLYNAQKESQLAAMRAQRDKAVGQINQQKAEVAPKYQQMRNQTDAVNQQNVQKLRELMAANGLSATGENVSANVTANNERLNSINALNQQEQQVMNDFDRRITDINNPAQEQSIIAAIEAQRSQALAGAYENAMNESYDRYRDTIGDQRYGQEFEYQKGRDARRDAEWESQQKADRAWREYTFNNMSASEKAQFEWAKQQFGEDMAWKMFSLQYQGELDKSMNQAQLDFYNNQGFPTP